MGRHEVEGSVRREFKSIEESLGYIGLLLFSHGIVLYLWMSLELFNGNVFNPMSLSWRTITDHVAASVLPQMPRAAALYFGFVIVHWVMAVTLPGVDVKGLPIAEEGGRQLEYKCNALLAWYITLVGLAIAQLSGWSISSLVDYHGCFLLMTMALGNAGSLIIYGISFVRGWTGAGFFEDYFMGACLNPRIGSLDLKMFFEIRISWLVLFLITSSCAALQFETTGRVSPAMALMFLAHLLYANACMKGEECIPTTWDIFKEKWGWMLVFWNICGVPFVYCFSSVFILKNDPQHSNLYIGICTTVLIGAYYVWDTANSQKNRFRMQLRGQPVNRPWAFPQLPWGTLDKPRYLKTDSGSLLLTDGWYRMARKIHYAADITMAFVWAFACGTTHLLPFVYPVFFVCMIFHRYLRDDARCAAKYGKDWDKYIETVPYVFIPYVF